ncbi:MULTISPECIES: VanZ family protein [unclassified Massilia]|uniref:VanZ family protein n=1 Tax=unclassified Massilia TaxID=2609279 RepID=UPI001B844265|nr:MULTISPECIES: VanZ family protein [unclassified Massilia]MBQ5942362.1 VanZ family protein [Massilia sp. AB1]MBQ5964972.1 VanZ family protein [Massilia sp. ZL223]
MPALLSLLSDPKYRRVLRCVALALFAGVLIAGSIPGARKEVGFYASGLVLHGLTYAFLASLWFFASTGNVAVRALKAVLAVALMGACDEFVQSFLPYRSGDIRDWLVDVSAASIASTVLALWLAKAMPARQQ